MIAFDQAESRGVFGTLAVALACRPLLGNVYHLMFRDNDQAINRETIVRNGGAAATLFKLSVDLFARQDGGIGCTELGIPRPIGSEVARKRLRLA